MAELLLKNVIGDGAIWFWTMCQAIAVIVTAVLVVRQLAVQRHTNMLDTLDRLRSRWQGDRLGKARRLTCSKFSHPDTKSDKSIKTDIEAGILEFFEDVGIFLQRRVVDRMAIWDNYSFWIEHYWQLLRPSVSEMRKTTSDNTWYENFEHVAETMVKVSKHKKAALSDKSDRQMSEFLIAECRLGQQQHPILAGRNIVFPAKRAADNTRSTAPLENVEAREPTIRQSPDASSKIDDVE